MPKDKKKTEELIAIHSPEDLVRMALRAESTLRRELGLISLTRRQRQLCKGKWLRTSHSFALRAADALKFHEPHLGPILPYQHQAIRDKELRVLALESIHTVLSHLAKESADTLLKERTELHGMATEVGLSLKWLRGRPFQSPELSIALDHSIENLYQDLASKNKKISRSMRSGQARITNQPNHLDKKIGRSSRNAKNTKAAADLQKVPAQAPSEKQFPVCHSPLPPPQESAGDLPMPGVKMSTPAQPVEAPPVAPVDDSDDR